MIMKKYYLNLDMPELFYRTKYGKESPQLCKTDLDNVQKIFQKDFISNGLLQIRFWNSDHFLQKWDCAFVSEELKKRFIESNFIESDRFIPIAYGWSLDLIDPVVPLPNFYLLDLRGKTEQDSVYMNTDGLHMEGVIPYRLFVDKEVLDVILTFDNHSLEYEEIDLKVDA